MLVFEDQTPGPGVHALVIGVSYYRHLAGEPHATTAGTDSGLKQLTGAARSAATFAEWLIHEHSLPQRPLKSVRMLLSPGQGETLPEAIEGLLGGKVCPATRDAAKAELGAFRQSCNADTQNVAIVYVAGHGLQLTKHGALVLLEDFADSAHLTELEGAINMKDVHGGFDHPGTASKQFWFVDACRQKPEIAQYYENLDAMALTLNHPGGRCEASPMFLASSTEEAAFGRIGGTSLFCEGLMWALKGGAAEGPNQRHDGWHISVSKLMSELPARVRELAEAEQLHQAVTPSGRMEEAVFGVYAVAPSVRLELLLEPPDAGAVATLTLSGEVIVNQESTWPIRRDVPAGYYILDLQGAKPPTVLSVQPLALTQTVEVP